VGEGADRAEDGISMAQRRVVVLHAEEDTQTLRALVGEEHATETRQLRLPRGSPRSIIACSMRKSRRVRRR